ncbi:hypothetical protein MNBD_GAMMA16-115 [hydrothermal vent metagenome]|uniref:Cytochrome c domain-containing protein n=1 Tax=hydrothermal vent metagenome TaxID=652676 RepID=A0A3B1A4S6_9ZZZZ
MRYIKLFTFAVLSLIVSSSAFASGSHDMSKENHADSTYNQGKTVVHKQLICQSCPLETANLDKDAAMTIIEKLVTGNTSVESISESDKQSVIVYLEKRFSLKQN